MSDSQMLSLTVPGITVSIATLRVCAAATPARSASGESSTSASTNNSQSPRAACAPCQAAHGLPIHPSGGARALDHANPCLFRDGTCFVGRVVVHHEDLERRQILGDQGRQAPRQHGFFVPGRNDHGYPRGGVRGHVGRNGRQAAQGPGQAQGKAYPEQNYEPGQICHRKHNEGSPCLTSTDAEDLHVNEIRQSKCVSACEFRTIRSLLRREMARVALHKCIFLRGRVVKVKGGRAIDRP